MATLVGCGGGWRVRLTGLDRVNCPLPEVVGCPVASLEVSMELILGLKRDSGTEALARAPVPWYYFSET